MTDRILDLSESPASLAVRTGRLVICVNDEIIQTSSFRDLAVIVASHPAVTYTQAVIARLLENNGVFIACNEKRMPVGMILPLDGHFIQAERFARQAAASLPTRKRLWQQIVKAKIRAQARLLNDLYDRDEGIGALADTVRSGDTGNVEAQAARRYWQALFRDTSFKRHREGDPPNNLLNYGYAVLRGIVARGLCAAGLHPSLGLHHHNRYNAFCLVDDLMEPLRPIVDRAVIVWLKDSDGDVDLHRETKRRLIGALTERVIIEGERRTLFDVAHITAVSLAGVFTGECRNLVLPEAG